jgi:hypothetical protein
MSLYNNIKNKINEVIYNNKFIIKVTIDKSPPIFRHIIKNYKYDNNNLHHNIIILIENNIEKTYLFPSNEFKQDDITFLPIFNNITLYQINLIASKEYMLRNYLYKNSISISNKQ